MAEPPKQEGLPEGAQYQAPNPKPKQNPAFRMMGMPNFRFKLPSRNWLIFLSITGSFAAAITYDRRQKKAAQKKWCDLVAHIAQQPLYPNQMPRKLTVFIAAPPGDGIRPSRDYFREYIKPVLVAAAMDYDVIEGKKEGEVRYGTAEQIRRLRRKKGERGNVDVELEPDREQSVEAIREKAGIRLEQGVRGDLVVGRHTWKEYIRGLHEGWLGPLDEPAPPPVAALPETINLHTIPGEEASSADEASPSLSPETSADSSTAQDPASALPEPPPDEEKKAPPSTPVAYISPSQYSASPLSQFTPQIFEPSAPIAQPHLLGFLKTPIRIYRFLNQRYLADQIGRETATVVLAASRPYGLRETFVASSADGSEWGKDDATPVAASDTEASSSAMADVVQTSQKWEQQAVLRDEEAIWHKSVRKPRKDDLERVWLDNVVLDSRLAERMRKFELAPEEEERAAHIGQGLEKGRAMEVQDLRSAKVVVEKFVTD